MRGQGGEGDRGRRGEGRRAGGEKSAEAGVEKIGKAEGYKAKEKAGSVRAAPPVASTGEAKSPVGAPWRPLPSPARQDQAVGEWGSWEVGPRVSATTGSAAGALIKQQAQPRPSGLGAGCQLSRLPAVGFASCRGCQLPWLPAVVSRHPVLLAQVP